MSKKIRLLFFFNVMSIAIFCSFLSHAGKEEFLAEVRYYQKNITVIQGDAGRRVFALRKNQADPKSTFAVIKESLVEKQEFISGFAKEMGLSCVSNCYAVDLQPIANEPAKKYIAEEFVALAPFDISHFSDLGKQFVALASDASGSCCLVDLFFEMRQFPESPEKEMYRTYVLDHFDPDNCQEIMLLYILLSSGDMAARNFMLTFTPEETIKIIKIDHEHDFLPYPNRIPLVYDFPQLEMPLSSHFIELIAGWHEKIVKYEQIIGRLFTNLPSDRYIVNDIVYTNRYGHRPYNDLVNRLKVFDDFIVQYPNLPFNKLISIAFSCVKPSYRLTQAGYDYGFLGKREALNNYTSLGDIIWNNFSSYAGPLDWRNQICGDSSQTLKLCQTAKQAKDYNVSTNYATSFEMMLRHSSRALRENITSAIRDQVPNRVQVRDEIVQQDIEALLLGQNAAIVELDKNKIQRFEVDGGYKYKLPYRFRRIAQLVGADAIVLLENDVPLRYKNALHYNIKRLGLGRYSVCDEFVYFSSSDNWDPRINGKTYKLALIQKKLQIKDVIVDRDLSLVTLTPNLLPTELKKNFIGFAHPYMYFYAMPQYLNDLFFSAATIVLSQNGQPFPLAHSPHGAIQHIGEGRYDVFKNGNLYFSTLTNVDPRETQNRYSLVPCQTEIKLESVSSGDEAKVLVPSQNPVIHILKKERMLHQEGNMFAYKIPDYMWKRFDRNPFSIVLVEDGIPLTTITNSHGSIKVNGGGLYNVFENQYLYFSTSDPVNFNPMYNEKTYALVLTERM